MEVYAGKESAELLDYLLKRRSVKADDLTAPGPNKKQLENMLRAASRVPDHGKMCPWYFIVFEGDAREKAGEVFARIYKDKNPNASDEQIGREAGRFMRAPLVVGIISRARKGKKPIWEQVLSAGAAAQNFSLAAHAQGFAVHWMSEWYAYDEDVKRALGLDERDHVAGFMYVGTPEVQPEERDRPELANIVTHWSPDAALNKGDEYDQDKFGFPETAFSFENLKKD